MKSDSTFERCDLELILIAAVAQNGVIGKDGNMPWEYPEDLQHFRSETIGSPVIMGRKAYEGILNQISQPLDGRINIVLSSSLNNQHPRHVVISRSILHAVKQANEVAQDGSCYIIGGAEIYEQFLPRSDKMILTEIPAAPQGDTYFPEWNRSEWEIDSTRQEGNLKFVTYVYQRN